MAISKKKRDELFRKFETRLRKELGTKKESAEAEVTMLPRRLVSAHYLEFKKELLPKHLNLYERLCNLSEKILRIRPDKKKSKALQEEISLCHLSATPSGVVSFSILAPIIFVVLTSMITYLLFKSLFFVVYAIIMGFVLMFVLQKLPEFFANTWRLKASNQMVECIFYIATYMRHTSNLELAVEFASKHLAPPLALDLKKVLWDVETQRYSTIKEALDTYLETWRKWNMEFIEAFHLIEGSLLEPSEDRRLSMVDKALNVMLQETYEKMLHYAHELKGPITMLYMIGIILPVLGLVILPLVASFMTSGQLMPDMLAIYIATLYNVTLPVIVFYMSRVTLSRRPTGYGEMDISEQNPELKKYKNIIFRIGSSEIKINPVYISIIMGVVLLLIGLVPLAVKYVVPKATLLREGGFISGLKFFDYHYPKAPDAPPDVLIGPYGIGAIILSLCIPLAIGLSIGLYYRSRTKNLMKIKEATKRLETEFASALFQLGNRLGDGLPPEIAIDRVASIMKDTVSGDFFETVSTNIHSLGMSVEQAIFHPKRGALVFFPSRLIESSMKVLVESSKKGPLIASQALINVSEYIKEIHRVNERLKDLMADIVGDMKQQVNMLAPAIAGIVVGITSMIITVIGRLGEQLGTIQQTAGQATQQFGGVGLLGMFGDGVPGFHFQVIVGVYIVQITYILTVLINGIESGSDKLSERHQLGQNLFRSTLLYAIVSFIIIILFNLLAVTIIGGIPLPTAGIS